MAYVDGQMVVADIASTALMTLRLNAVLDNKMMAVNIATSSTTGLMRVDLRSSGSSAPMLVNIDAE